MDEEKKDIIEEESPKKNVQALFGLPISTLAIIGIVAIAIIVAIIIGITGNNDNNSSDIVNCLSCGDSFDDTMNFCPNCGAKKETPNPDNNNTNSGGNNSTNVCSHNWKTATCTMPKTCSKCGETSGNALGHTWKAASCTQPKTCSKCGKNEGNALGHTTDTGICSRCNIRQGWTKDEVQALIKVYSVFVDEINSAGGVDMKIAWENTSSKTIKYVYFTVEAYNAVDDKVYCEIGDYNEFTGYSTGPFEAGYTTLIYDSDDDEYYVDVYWENCYYNSNIRYFILTNIRIIYMDNTEIQIDDNYVDYAFSELPQGLTYLWNEEFNGYVVECRLRENCTYSNITIPSTYNGKNVVAISDYGFADISTLSSINLPNTLKYIGDGAFSNCSNLKTIEIPLSVEEIGSYAFENCSKLNDIYIPDNVESMGYSMIQGCSNVKTISIPFLDFRFRSMFGGNVPDCLNKVELRGGIAIIDEAFKDCHKITEIVLPDTITSIGESAFSGCNSLIKIKIPSKVISIGRHAFYKCYSITEVIIPYGVETIDSIAFVDCTNLKKITIPNSVKTMGYYVFSGCKNLTIYCGVDYQPIGWDDDWNYMGYDNGSQYCPVIWGYND